MTRSFFRCDFAAEEKIEEQYSICDLIRAVYNNFNRSLGRYGVALANIPRSPWHWLTTLSICGPKVRCWSKVTPSNFTVFSGLMIQLSSVRWKSSGMGLPGFLNKISCIFSELIFKSWKSQNFFTASKLTHQVISDHWQWRILSSKCGVVGELEYRWCTLPWKVTDEAYPREDTLTIGCPKGGSKISGALSRQCILASLLFHSCCKWLITLTNATSFGLFKSQLNKYFVSILSLPTNIFSKLLFALLYTLIM